MNLAAAISLYSGGPGSGCNPAVGHCGRPRLKGHGPGVPWFRKVQRDAHKEEDELFVQIKVNGRVVGHVGVAPNLTEGEYDMAEEGDGVPMKPVWHIADMPEVANKYAGKGYGATLYYRAAREI